MRDSLLSACVVFGFTACARHGVPEPRPTLDADVALTAAPGDAADAGRIRVIDAPRAARPNCRAIAVTGEVLAVGDDEAGAGTPLATEQVVPEVWLALAPEARLVAKDPRTSRETTFVGPARARACVGHKEESWLVDGTFESTTGSGEAPGAEEWVETPLGIVRYGSATLRITVTSERVVVAVGSGAAFVWLPSDATFSLRPGNDAGARPSDETNDDAWVRVAGAILDVRPRARRSLPEGARTAVAECSSLARRTEALLADLAEVARSDGGRLRLASAIAQQVTARRVARASCAVATVRVHTMTPSRETSALTVELTEVLTDAEERWSLPRPRPAAP